MGRWTQYDEDSYRLPEGVERIAYDADTRQYTFRDQHGNIYHGEPGAEYGILTLESKAVKTRSTPVKSPRPLFETDVSNSPLRIDTNSLPKSFLDILPPDRMTSASPLSDNSISSSSSASASSPQSTAMQPAARWVNAVRRTAMPKMQDVVSSVMKRSPTLSKTHKKANDRDADGTGEKLLSNHDAASLKRSATTASTRSYASSITLLNEKPLPNPEHELPALPSIPLNLPDLPSFEEEDEEEDSTKETAKLAVPSS